MVLYITSVAGVRVVEFGTKSNNVKFVEFHRMLLLDAKHLFNFVAIVRHLKYRHVVSMRVLALLKLNSNSKFHCRINSRPVADNA